jgi:hypothetical protein
MGFANNLVPAEIARDPQRMQSLAAYLLGAEAESSSRLDGETYPIDTLPRAWIFDLDGTLFCTNRDAPDGGRGWFDYARLLEDWPIQGTLEIARNLMRAEEQILYVTARPEEAREQTLVQLERNWLVPPYRGDDLQLFMRPTMEHLDHDLKRMIYRNEIKPRWQVQGVFEDNEDVAEMYVNEGLTVFLVKGPHQA